MYVTFGAGQVNRNLHRIASKRHDRNVDIVYNAVSMLEGGFDVRSMCRDSTKVFVLETMGRHAGWIAGATALARANGGVAPHIILLPAVIFDQSQFIKEAERFI